MVQVFESYLVAHTEHFFHARLDISICGSRCVQLATSVEEASHVVPADQSVWISAAKNSLLGTPGITHKFFGCVELAVLE